MEKEVFDMDKKSLALKKEVRKWIGEHYGKRCKKYAVGCGCCEAWRAFDLLFDYEQELDWDTHTRVSPNTLRILKEYRKKQREPKIDMGLVKMVVKKGEVKRSTVRKERRSGTGCPGCN